MTTAPTGACAPAPLLAAHELSATRADPELAQIARLAAAVCGVPTAAVNLLDRDTQHQVAAHGFAALSTPRSASMCDRTAREVGPVVVRDASRDPRFCDNPWVTGPLAAIRFYAAHQLRDSSQVVIGTLCVFDEVPRELTEQQHSALGDLADQTSRLLAQRREARLMQEHLRDLDRSNTELAAFAGRIAHDLSSPLSGVRGFLQLALRRGGEVPPLVDSCLQQATVAAERVQDMLDGLLRYAVSGAPAPFCEVDLDRLAQSVRGDLGRHLQEAHAELSIGELGVLCTDPLLLGQVLQNLLCNAVKYRSPDRPCVLRLDRRRRGGGRTTLTVIDNGRGIPDEAKARVFELFRRGSNAGAVPGSGIGLATCARNIEALGGSIELADTPGGGLTVFVHLPG